MKHERYNLVFNRIVHSVISSRWLASGWWMLSETRTMQVLIMDHKSIIAPGYSCVMHIQSAIEEVVVKVRLSIDWREYLMMYKINWSSRVPIDLWIPNAFIDLWIASNFCWQMWRDGQIIIVVDCRTWFAQWTKRRTRRRRPDSSSRFVVVVIIIVFVFENEIRHSTEFDVS